MANVEPQCDYPQCMATKNEIKSVDIGCNSH